MTALDWPDRVADAEAQGDYTTALWVTLEELSKVAVWILRESGALKYIEGTIPDQKASSADSAHEISRRRSEMLSAACDEFLDEILEPEKDNEPTNPVRAAAIFLSRYHACLAQIGGGDEDINPLDLKSGDIPELMFLAFEMGMMSGTLHDVAGGFYAAAKRGVADLADKQAGAEKTNRLREIELAARDEIVGDLAKLKLSGGGFPSGYSSWTREALVGEVRDAWPDDEDVVDFGELEGEARATAKGKAKPSLGKIKASLKRLGLPPEA